MSVGNLRDQGNKGNNFPYQLAVLKLLDAINTSVSAIPGTDYETRTTTYQAIAAGAGYSIGDIIVRYDIIDVATSTIISTIWFNQTTQAVIAAPAPAALTPYLPPGNVTVNNTSFGITNWLGSLAPTVGQKTMASSIPVTLASDQPPINVLTLNSQTYSAAIVGLAVAAAATDIFTLTGSATKTIKIRKVTVSATRTADAKTDLVMLVRSTANSGGTSTAPTRVPHDSLNAAATGTVLAYTANPTLGALVGIIRARKQYIPVAASSTLESETVYVFGEETNQAIILRGVSQVFSINLNGQTITGPSFDISITWTEE